MTLVLPKSEEFWIVLIALMVAATLAAHQVMPYAEFGWLGSYLYWTSRILIQTAFFIAALYAVERYLGHRLMPWMSFALAIIVSLIPFTLAITAFDLIAGLPELGLNGADDVPSSNARAFVMEVFYLFDNHLFLCLLLWLPRLLSADVQKPELASSEPTDEPEVPTWHFLDSLEPPLEGRVCSIEAQEHYIKVTTTHESRMVLHRFSDAVKQLPPSLGMQVHRSHWVAHFAVQGVVQKGQSMKLTLDGEQEVPVSRTFRASVESRYAVS